MNDIEIAMLDGRMKQRLLEHFGMNPPQGLAFESKGKVYVITKNRFFSYDIDRTSWSVMINPPGDLWEEA